MRAASMLSASSLAIALLRPADFTIVSTPPVSPRFELTMNENIAGSNSNAERAAIISRMMITVTKGVIASMGIP